MQAGGEDPPLEMKLLFYRQVHCMLQQVAQLHSCTGLFFLGRAWIFAQLQTSPPPPRGNYPPDWNKISARSGFWHLGEQPPPAPLACTAMPNSTSELQTPVPKSWVDCILLGVVTPGEFSVLSKTCTKATFLGSNLGFFRGFDKELYIFKLHLFGLSLYSTTGFLSLDCCNSPQKSIEQLRHWRTCSIGLLMYYYSMIG